MLVDLHLHSSFSFDSEEKTESYLRSANKIGSRVIGFSEHYDYDAVLDGAEIAVADLDAYFAELKRLESVSGSSGFNGCPQILRGIEFGYRAEALPRYRELSEKYAFDYIINSVHTLPDRGDCYHDGFFVGKPLKESYHDYFNAVLESVKADFDYQIIGHVGYVSRYRKGADAQIKYADFHGIIDEILKEIIRRDKCLEINTSTGYSASNFLPDCDIVKRYLELGGKLLSYGSDAHSAKDYYRKGDRLTEFLQSIGVKEMYYFKSRKPVAYKI